MYCEMNVMIYEFHDGNAFKSKFHSIFMNPTIPTIGEDMEKCHICGETIWEDRWPAVTDSSMKKHICSFCFSKIRSGGNYMPKVYTKSNLAVCDNCGEISTTVKLTNVGWLCEDCR